MATYTVKKGDKYNPYTGKKLSSSQQKAGTVVSDKGKTVSSSSSSNKKSTSSSSSNKTTNATTYTVKAGDKYNPFTGEVLSSNIKPGTVLTSSGSPGQTNSTNTVSTLSSKTLEKGSKGNEVKALQQALIDAGYNVGSSGADGIYGTNTVNAVKQYQRDNGLTADGIVGKNTIASVNQKISSSSALKRQQEQEAAARAEEQAMAQEEQTKAQEAQARAEEQARVQAEREAQRQIEKQQKNAEFIAEMQRRGIEVPPGFEVQKQKGVGKFSENYPGLAPEEKELLDQLDSYVQSAISQGLKVNPKLIFNQKNIDKFLETAKRQLEPYYAQQIDAIKQNVLSDVKNLESTYSTEIAKSQDQFSRGLGQTRESLAGSGLAFSGYRGQQEKAIEEAQNRSLESLGIEYGSRLREKGIEGESKLGTAGMGYSIPGIKKYRASLLGKGGFLETGMETPYTPGTYKLGEIPQEREAETEKRKQALMTTATENILAGRSYQDLFQ